MIDFNKEYYDEKIDSLEKGDVILWKKVSTIENKLWGIILLLVFNFGGMLVNILLSYNK